MVNIREPNEIKHTPAKNPGYVLLKFFLSLQLAIRPYCILRQPKGPYQEYSHVLAGNWVVRTIVAVTAALGDAFGCQLLDPWGGCPVWLYIGKA
jgi:hypothetical protein